MAENFNINTTQQQANEAEGLEPNNPAMTYVDFANQMVKNSQAQQEQEALIQQAQEQAKQLSLGTKQKIAAGALGINPSTKGYLSKDEALALMKAELSRQNLLTDEVNDQLMAWYNAAPEMVEQQDVKDFISRYQPKTPKAGAPFVATDADASDKDKMDETGKSLVAGQSYFLTQDEDGNTIYERGGNVPQEKGGTTAHQTNQRWSSLEKELTAITKVGRGTALTQSLMRANRALNYLANHANLDRQGLMYIQQDMVGIFQGGVPTEQEMQNADYTTAIQKINTIIGKYTGSFGSLKWNSVTAGDQSYVRDQLQSTLLDMRQGIMNTLETMVQAVATGYEDIISDDPQRWHRMLEAFDKVINSGVTANAQAIVNPSTPTNTPTSPTAAPAAAPTGAPNVDALAAALGLKKKAQ